MKNEVKNILNEYLQVYNAEVERQSTFLKFLEENDDNDITDWNNFNGHIVASGFVYAKEQKKFLVLYHNEFKTFMYPGGHIEANESTLEAAKREISEETGIKDLKQILLNNNELIPIDIDTHLISYNQKLNLPEHYHFDFRYLFTIDSIEEVKLDFNESSDYKWIDVNELKTCSFGIVIDKINRILNI